MDGGPPGSGESQKKKFSGALLVVEDDADMRELLESEIGRHFEMTLSTSSGPEAIAIAIEKQPSVIVTDLNIAGFDGLQVVAKLRSKGLSPVIIVISGQSQRDHLLSALRLGVADFVEKPFSFSELTARIERAVYLRQKEGEPAESSERSRNLKMSGLVRVINAFGARARKTG